MCYLLRESELTPQRLFLTAPYDAPTETYATTLSYNFGVLDLAVALRLQQQAEIPDGR